MRLLMKNMEVLVRCKTSYDEMKLRMRNMRVVLVKSEDTENYNLELWVVERCESSYETVKVDKNRWNFSKDIVDETSDEKCMSSSELWIFLWWDESSDDTMREIFWRKWGIEWFYEKWDEWYSYDERICELRNLIKCVKWIFLWKMRSESVKWARRRWIEWCVQGGKVIENVVRGVTGSKFLSGSSLNLMFCFAFYLFKYSWLTMWC